LEKTLSQWLKINHLDSVQEFFILAVMTQDGWVEEAELFDIGWILDSTNITESFLNNLETQILPLYYTNPEKWEQMRKNAEELGHNQFTTTRILFGMIRLCMLIPLQLQKLITRPS
jgi:hypothetical protein